MRRGGRWISVSVVSGIVVSSYSVRLINTMREKEKDWVASAHGEAPQTHYVLGRSTSPVGSGYTLNAEYGSWISAYLGDASLPGGGSFKRLSARHPGALFSYNCEVLGVFPCMQTGRWDRATTREKFRIEKLLWLLCWGQGDFPRAVIGHNSNPSLPRTSAHAPPTTFYARPGSIIQ